MNHRIALFTILFAAALLLAPAAVAAAEETAAAKAPEAAKEAPTAAAEPVKVKGRIKAFDLKEKTVTVDIDGVETVFQIENEKALEKLDTKLFVGDEVKIKFVVKDGKKTILTKDDMRGTKPGC